MSEEKNKQITLTPSAVSEIKKQLAAVSSPLELRMSVVGGGCSGYQYQMNPIVEDNKITDYDELFHFDDLTIVIDMVSLGYLDGTTVDFVSELNRTGFVFNNPNARRTCGCGSSFS